MVDIKKKNRIIQAYYMKMEPGDLISEETELHKAICDKYFNEGPMCSLILLPG